MDHKATAADLIIGFVIGRPDSDLCVQGARGTTSPAMTNNNIRKIEYNKMIHIKNRRDRVTTNSSRLQTNLQQHVFAELSATFIIFNVVGQNVVPPTLHLLQVL
ncbi:hypothetical protein QTP88_012071 [Uroleucon formosanum]